MSSTTKINNFSCFMVNLKTNILKIPEINILKIPEINFWYLLFGNYTGFDMMGKLKYEQIHQYEYNDFNYPKFHRFDNYKNYTNNYNISESVIMPDLFLKENSKFIGLVNLSYIKKNFGRIKNNLFIKN
jgi:hypothetical protein